MSLQAYVLRKLAQVHLRDDLDSGAARRQADAQRGHSRICRSVCRARASWASQRKPRAAPTSRDASFVAARAARLCGCRELAAAARPALSRLDQLVPAAKEQLIEGLVKTIGHDRRLTIAEAELLRAVCAALHCPLPPLLAEA